MHLERSLRRAGNDLANRQVARFWKVPEDMSQTPCDFMGFTVHGRVVMIEAKQVARSSLPIANSPGLQKHQFGALQECWRAGGIAIVAWAHRGMVAVLPFETVMRLSIQQSRMSIAWKDIPCGMVGDEDSYLGVLERVLVETPKATS